MLSCYSFNHLWINLIFHVLDWGCSINLLRYFQLWKSWYLSCSHPLFKHCYFFLFFFFFNPRFLRRHVLDLLNLASVSLFFTFLWPHLWHMGIPGLEVKLELQLPAYTAATATSTQDPSCICELRHNLWQHWILNPLRKVRDGVWILTDTTSHHVRFLTSWATIGTPHLHIFKSLFHSFCLCTSFWQHAGWILQMQLPVL